MSKFHITLIFIVIVILAASVENGILVEIKRKIYNYKSRNKKKDLSEN